jgi:hypothetical protein
MRDEEKGEGAGERCVIIRFIIFILLLHQCNIIEETETAQACRKHGRYEKCILKKLYFKNLKRRDHLRCLGINSKIISRWILRK